MPPLASPAPASGRHSTGAAMFTKTASPSPAKKIDWSKSNRLERPQSTQPAGGGMSGVYDIVQAVELMQSQRDSAVQAQRQMQHQRDNAVRAQRQMQIQRDKAVHGQKQMQEQRMSATQRQQQMQQQRDAAVQGQKQAQRERDTSIVREQNISVATCQRMQKEIDRAVQSRQSMESHHDIALTSKAKMLLERDSAVLAEAVRTKERDEANELLNAGTKAHDEAVAALERQMVECELAAILVEAVATLDRQRNELNAKHKTLTAERDEALQAQDKLEQAQKVALAGYRASENERDTAIKEKTGAGFFAQQAKEDAKKRAEDAQKAVESAGQQLAEYCTKLHQKRDAAKKEVQVMKQELEKEKVLRLETEQSLAVSLVDVKVAKDALIPYQDLVQQIISMSTETVDISRKNSEIK